METSVIVLYLKPAAQFARSVIAEYLFIARVIISIFWLSFLDLIDPSEKEEADDDHHADTH